MANKHPLADCENCPLQNRRMAPSTIRPNAPLIIVSDRPGIEEILQQGTLVGQTGDVVNKALQTCGIDHTTVAKANAVLCLPYDDEVPPAAVRACKTRLAHDIKTSGAQRILAAGKYAQYAIDLLVNGDKAKLAGSMINAGQTTMYNDKITVTATVNPAFLFHNDGYTPNFVRHMYKALRPVPQLDVWAVKYIVMDATNMESLIAWIDSKPDKTPMAFDVETDHLMIWDTPTSPHADFLCAVLSFDTKLSIIIPNDMMTVWTAESDPGDFMNPPAPVRVIDHLQYWLQEKYHIITQNGKYDQNVMAARFGIHFDVHDDTLPMHYGLEETGKHGLKEMGTEYLGIPAYENIIVDWFKAHGMAEEKKRRYGMLPKDLLYRYAAIDGAVTYALWYLFKADLITQGLYDRPYLETFIPTVNMLSTVEQNGIGIDRPLLAHARIMLTMEIDETEAKMNDMVLAELDKWHSMTASRNVAAIKDLTRLMIGKKKGDPLRYNPNSPQQTSYIIYDLFGLELTGTPIKETGTNTGEECLNLLPPHPWIDLLKHARHMHKMRSTYIEGIDRRADTDDILHVDFRFQGTEVGRLSAANADHGIPRPDDFWGTLIRSLFICKNDEVLIVADYSQAELRAFALLSQCSFLLDKYRNGKDVHDETSFMLEDHGAAFFRGFRLLHETKKKMGNDPVAYLPTLITMEKTAQALIKVIPDLEKHIQDAMMPYLDEDESVAKPYAEHILKLISNKHKAIRTVAKNINFGGLVYQGGAPGISGMIGGIVSIAEIAAILKVYKPLMPEAAIYAENQYQHMRKYGYVETAFGRRRRFHIMGEHNEDEIRKAVVHMVVAGSAADLNNHAAVRLVKQGVKVCHLVHDSILMRAPRMHGEAIAELAQKTMIEVGEEFMPGVPWEVDIDRLSDGQLPQRWVESPAIPDKYLAALARAS